VGALVPVRRPGLHAAVLLVLVVPSSAAVEGAPRLLAGVEPGAAGFGTVWVEGLPSERLSRLERLAPDAPAWLDILAVRTRVADLEGLPAMLGAWRVAGDRIAFEPRFPLVAGRAYHARFDGGALERWTGVGEGGTPSLMLEFALPTAARGEPPAVEAVYPSGGEVPENLLRLYVHFTRPMNRRGVAGHTLLRDAAGRRVGVAFVDVEHGLWDPTGRRLTLFVHPGRVKRGVGLRRAMGPVLEAGREYSLVVDGSLEDSRGVALGEDFVHTFRVVAADRIPPDASVWELLPPVAPDAPVALELHEALDHALLGRLVSVQDATGGRVEGTVEVSRSETRWSFRPSAPWRPGRYWIVVPERLEDPAGNSLRGPFEGGPGAFGGQGPVRLEFCVP